MKLVEVTWHDTHAHGGGWQKPPEILAGDANRHYVVRSVGFLLYSDKRHVILVQTLAPGDLLSDTVTIPKGCVKRIRKLR